jgi:hypothetical protein
MKLLDPPAFLFCRTGFGGGAANRHGLTYSYRTHTGELTTTMAALSATRVRRNIDLETIMDPVIARLLNAAQSIAVGAPFRRKARFARGAALV